MAVKIKMIVGPNKGETLVLDQSCTKSLGRDPESDLVLPAPNASRSHAQLKWDGEHLTIEDLKSRNGVYINANRIENKSELGTGDVVEVGGCVFSVMDMGMSDFGLRKTVNIDDDEEEPFDPHKEGDGGTSGFKPSPSYDPDTGTISDEDAETGKH